MTQSRPLLIYDGDCGFCERSARWFERLNRHGHVLVRAWQEPGVLEASGLTELQCREAAWFISAGGQRYRGADAIFAALGELGTPWRWLTWICRWSLLHALAGHVYGWVARNRHRLPGGTPRCASARAETPER